MIMMHFCLGHISTVLEGTCNIFDIRPEVLFYIANLLKTVYAETVEPKSHMIYVTVISKGNS